MQKIKEAASEFLATKRVAVTGVSRHAKDHGSNVVYKRLRDRGYEVYAVIPTRTKSKEIAVITTFARFREVSMQS